MTVNNTLDITIHIFSNVSLFENRTFRISNALVGLPEM